MKTQKSLLDKVKFPRDLKKFDDQQLKVFCKELRDEVIDAVCGTGGHLGAGLGVVELTVAIHSVFNTPNDKLEVRLFDSIVFSCHEPSVINLLFKSSFFVNSSSGYLM